MGPEVVALETMLAQYVGTCHAVTCASGTDALQLLLMARGIGRGDAVFLPAFTFTATAEVVSLLGATPVFVDVEPSSFNVDIQSLAAAVQCTARGPLSPKAIVAVDLFGQPADYTALNRLAAENDMFVIEDAAQSFGASRGNVRAGALTHAAATSFFPAKPLGCYGDGGAIFTDDDEVAEICRSLRAHGKGEHKYEIVRVGLNSRMDTVQAAVLIEKLAIFDEEIAARHTVAARYQLGLGGVVDTPGVSDGSTSVWAQYTIKVDERDQVAALLKAQGIPTGVYYPSPLGRQPAYAHCPTAPGGVPVSETLARQVLSLPMHPYLDDATQGRIIEAVIHAVG